MSRETKPKSLLIIIAFLLTILSTAADGRIIYVDDDGPADFNNIQAAINDANNGDTIIVNPGIFRESINFLGKNITLTSMNPNDWNVVATTIIGDTTWPPRQLCKVTFRGTENASCKLTGFNILSYIVGYDYKYGQTHTHATISHCVLQYVITSCGPVIYAVDGIISNCIIANHGTICLVTPPTIVGCNGLIKNCTITSNFTPVSVGGRGTCTIENSIIYGNLYQVEVSSGATLNISYCDLENGQKGISGSGTINWGPGNINLDPCFADKWSDYHLKSQAGRWDANSSSWVKDDLTSLCIDAGDPGSPIGLEPFPNGGIINMGAYGGTEEASKSYFGEPVCEVIVAGDINGDCIVNFKDFSLIAYHWLEEH